MATLIDLITEAYAYGQAGNVTVQPQETDPRFVKGRTFVNRRIKRLATTREFQFPTAFREFELKDATFTAGTTRLWWQLPNPDNPVGEIDQLFLTQHPTDVVRLLYGVGAKSFEARYLIVDRTVLQTPRLLDQTIQQANNSEIEYNGAAAFWNYRVYLSGLPSETITTPRLLIPHYDIPVNLVDPTDEFNLLHDTSYIVRSAAADIAANNPVTRDLYQSLLAEARDAFDDLKAEYRPQRAVPVIRTGVAPLYQGANSSDDYLSSDVFINSEGQAVNVNLDINPPS